MKKKNGFTMIEILGVVILIVAISLLVFPAMLEQFRKAKDDINESTLNLIYSGANTLINDDLQSYPKKNGNTYCISLKALVEEGYVSDSIKNVINDRDYDLNVATVKASYINDKFNYDFIDDGSCVPEIALVYRTFYEIMSESAEVDAFDPDHNMRYVGTDPDNYVWFNNELWRIVGLFGEQPKLVRNNVYAESIAWDTNGGVNWGTSSLQLELNGDFLSGMDQTSLNYIDQEYVWGYSNVDMNLNNEEMYELERNNLYTWTGAIGLLYASDHGYSLDSDETINIVGSPCGSVQGSWLALNNRQWLLDIGDQYVFSWPVGSNSVSMLRANCLDGFHYSSSSDVIYYGMHNEYNLSARPALYFKSNVVVIDGLGTYDDPYQLYMP